MEKLNEKLRVNTEELDKIKGEKKEKAQILKKHEEERE